ncbi:5382_t:CDS:2, partial [Paraglomus occultum]
MAIQYQNSGSYDEAIKILHQDAHTPALFELAQRYEDGNGVRQCHRRAVLAYKQAAHLGHPYAQYRLSLYYYYGTVVEKDYNKAFELCLAAVEKGVTDAQCLL